MQVSVDPTTAPSRQRGWGFDTTICSILAGILRTYLPLLAWALRGCLSSADDIPGKARAELTRRAASKLKVTLHQRLSTLIGLRAERLMERRPLADCELLSGRHTRMIKRIRAFSRGWV